MIEMGKKYRTRGGMAVRVLAVDLDANGAKQPVVGYLYGVGVVFFNKDGSYRSGAQSSYDLIEVHPLEGVPVDTPIWIRDNPKESWAPRHFAGICPTSGFVLAWSSGLTSHSQKDLELSGLRGHTPWAEYSLTKP